MRIEPQSEIVLARGLENHTDSTTYYVRAVIRNAKTDAIISVNGLNYVNLTDNGDRRFTKPWRVPADPTGEGFDVLITYTVYTDSGYTTKDQNYGEKFDRFRIEHTPRTGGGGADVDYKRIKKIVEEELTKLDIPKAKDVDLTPLSNAIQSVIGEVRGINIPKPQPVNLQPLAAQIDALSQSLAEVEDKVKTAIMEKEIPQTDLTEIQSAMEEIRQQMAKLDFSNLDKTSDTATQLLERIKQFYRMDMDELKDNISKLEKKFSKIAYVTLQTNKDDE